MLQTTHARNASHHKRKISPDASRTQHVCRFAGMRQFSLGQATHRQHAVARAAALHSFSSLTKQKQPHCQAGPRISRWLGDSSSFPIALDLHGVVSAARLMRVSPCLLLRAQSEPGSPRCRSLLGSSLPTLPARPRASRLWCRHHQTRGLL